AGNAGTGSPVTGAPHAGREACATDGTACGGTCDGTKTSACVYPTVSCREASCGGATAILAASCDGAGACPLEQTQPCAPYLCGPNACAGDCHADGDCASGSYCSAGRCAPKPPPGRPRAA